MPAKKLTTNEIIIKEALIILKENGSEFLNARFIAKKLGISTQPLYSCFKNMEELRNELLKECKKKYEEYLAKAFLDKNNNLFNKYLFSYILFAKNEPQYFRYLYMDNKHINNKESRVYDDKVVHSIMKVSNYSYEFAYNFYLLGRIFAHGLATQIVTGYLDWDEKTIKLLLDEQFKALRNLYGSNKN